MNCCDKIINFIISVCRNRRSYIFRNNTKTRTRYRHKHYIL
uniref:Uncharacterized protein n=1 Tax=viral metagenome TaxID=1070528 RepID=A0A6C0BDV4_9ZZZZ